MSEKKILITQSNYIPWKGYFDSIALADELIVFDEMQYTKRDWRNRNKIKTPSGTKWLSIPVQVKGKYFQKISETLISEQTWKVDHWNAIIQNYQSAHYFKEISSWLEELYLGCELERLSQINLRFIERINKYLGINTSIIDSAEFDLSSEKTQRLVDICVERKATEYLTGPAAKNYMDESLFINNNIKVTYLDYSGYEEYPQLHGDFDHAVTILDLLFSCGPESTSKMKYVTSNQGA